MIRRNLSNHVLRLFLICVIALATMGGLFVGTALAATFDTVTVTDNAPAVIKGSDVTDFLHITLADASAGNLESIIVTGSGATLEGDIDRISLYLDDNGAPGCGNSGNGTFDGTDILLGYTGVAGGLTNAFDGSLKATFDKDNADGGIGVGGIGTVCPLVTSELYFVVVEMAASPTNTNTVSLQILATDIDESAATDDGPASALPSPAASATIDSQAPTVVNTYSVDTNLDGDIDAFDIEFSEAIFDASFTAGDFEFDNDNTNDGIGEETATAGSTGVTYPAVVNVADDKWYRVTVPNGISGTEAADLHIIGTGTQDLIGNSIATADSVGTQNDRADPVLLSFTSTTSDLLPHGPGSGINVRATYSENISSGSITVNLDNTVTLALSTISTNRIEGTYTVGLTGTGEDTPGLSVSSITVHTAADAFPNTNNILAPLPIINITTGSTLVVDTTAPAAPSAPDMQVGSDSNINNDDITNNITPIFDISGLESGATAYLISDVSLAQGSAVESPGTGIAPVTAIGLIGSIAGTVHSMTATQTDIAGNSSVASASLSPVTIDTGVAQPVAPVLQPASDSGVLDNITNIDTPIFDGVAGEAGSWLYLYTSFPSHTHKGGRLNSGSMVAATLQSTAQAGDVHIMTIEEKDVAGNVSVPSLGLAVTIDITPPTPVVTVSVDPIYTGALTQTVTVTYNEAMDPTTNPTITMGGTFWGPQTPTGWTAGDTVYTATFTHNGTPEENAAELATIAAASGALDVAGNAENGNTSPTFVVDTQAPTLPIVTIASNNADPTKAVLGDTITLTMTPSEPINQPAVAFKSGGAGVNVPTTYAVIPAPWDASYVTTVLDSSGLVGFTVDFVDTAGNAGTTQVTATTDASSVTVDLANPTVLTYSPADDAANAAILANLVLTFDENVVVGVVGNVVLYKSDDSIIETFDVTGGLVTFNGTTGVTINPTSALVNSTAYYVQIDAAAIEDTFGNPYAGIVADKTTWNFTTVAVPPLPVSSGGSGGNAGGRVVPAETTPTEPTTPETDGTTTPADFWDIDGHWGESYIDQVNEAGYVEGYEDSSFRPNIYITRAEASKLIASWLNPDLTDADCDGSIFNDVACSEWYGPYVTYLYLQDIIEGYGEGTFNPGANVSRAEALKMLLYTKNLHNSDVAGVSNPFPDNDSGAWYYDLVLIGYDLGIVQGYEDGTFKPTNAITRAEFTKIFDKILLDI